MPITSLDRESCVAHVPGQEGPYGYQPSFAAGIVFCILFGMSMLAHVFQSVRTRTWWQTVFAVGAVTEVIGWAGRTWSSDCPYQTTPFLIQITTLIIAPAFFTAGIYIILGRLIRTFGDHVSPIGPNTYLYIFCTADIVSLIIQAVGGASASLAYEKTPPGDTATGTHIMVAGILFQLAAIIIFVILFILVVTKALKTSKETMRERTVRSIIIATVFSVVCIVIRSIYRTIELLQGWEGYLITTERFFLVLDGAMMVLALAVFNFAQPRWAEPRTENGKNSSELEDASTHEGDSFVQGVEKQKGIPSDKHR